MNLKIVALNEPKGYKNSQLKSSILNVKKKSNSNLII